MNDISLSKHIWRRYAIFFVSSYLLAPLTFFWFGGILISLFIDSSTTVGWVSSMGILLVSYFSVGSLARTEVATIREEMLKNPEFAEITKTIMEAARKANEQQSGSINENGEEEKSDKDDEK